MIDKKILNVFYHGKEVGRLLLTKENLCAFEYDSNWISDGFSISPFKLPLKKGVFIAERDPFFGNYLQCMILFLQKACLENIQQW